MIDSNGKIFGKVSVVDIAILLAVVIAVAGVYVRFFGRTTDTTVAGTDFYYTFLVENIRESNLEGLKKSVGSRFSLNEKITGDMGTLLEIKESTAIAEIVKNDGTVVRTEIDGRYDAVLTFKINGKYNENGYFSSSLEDISAGVTYSIISKWSAVGGEIQKVWN